jgi:beta-galactosidase
MRLVSSFERLEAASLHIGRRDVLKGIGAVGAFPLLADRLLNSQEPRNREHGVESDPVSDHTREQLFDLGWRFLRGDIAGAESSGFDDSAWRKVDLPHDWSIEDLTPNAEAAGQGTIWVGGNAPTRIGPFDVALSQGQEATGWVVGGIGWYRKHFQFAPANQNARAEIRFDGVYMNSEVWINGHSLGSHPYGYTPFVYDLTQFLKHADENVLAVKVRNEGANSRWYSGSGIYRHVWLTLTGDLRIPVWGVGVQTPKVSRELSTIEVSVAVENRAKVQQAVTIRTRILGPGGTVAAGGDKATELAAGDRSSASQTLEVKDAQLWSPGEPNLYRAEVEVLLAGKVVDRSTVSFGIRSIEVSIEQGLRINGEPVKLKGGCAHHDNGILGAAAFDRAEERRVEILKSNGFNAIRTSHNPPSPMFLDTCDRLGMMVIDEAFDCWNLGKNDDDYHVYFTDWWERDLKSMLMRDRNHPSILFWSIGNEIDGRRDTSGVAIAKQLRDAVKSIDSSRPVTMAVPGPYDHNLPEWQANDPAFLHLDVGGYNYQWQQYETDHKRFPNRIMMGTESFPFEAYDSWRSAERLSYVLGDFVWTAIDYLGESAIGHSILSQTPGWWRQQYPWFNSYCGDIDLIGEKKPQSFYRDVLWRRSPLEIAVQRPLPRKRTEELANWGWRDELRSWSWKGYEGFPLKVRVFTAGDRVKLLLNGKEIGEKPVPESAKLIAEFDVPYAEGELRAIAFKDEREIASSALKSVGKAARLHVRVDRGKIRPGRGELAFATIEITDAAGGLVPDMERRIDFRIEGAGELAAVGNANPKDVASFREPTCKTFNGKCLAVLRSLGREGRIALRVTSEGLTPATAIVECASL